MKTTVPFGALFDLDGVLIDSETTYTRFWTEIDRIYPTGIENYALAIKGTTLPEIMKHYDDSRVRADILRRITEFQESMTYELYPGVVDFLSMLRDSSVPMAIVTSSDDRKMAHLFRQHPGFQKLFDAIVDASMVTRSKPDPQGYLLGAERIGVAPENCFVFEDSLQGLKAGRAAGAVVVGLATTYPAQKIAPLADKVIDGLGGVTLGDLISLKNSLSRL
ncbi:MAG: HAD family phosphatase [Paramuribaculum sp.]|nr:HAD family phosphatase [Paramuribaculum sp.]